MMKMMHLSDLHLGKRLNDFSLLDDQRYILDQIVNIAKQHRPDCILIAGDLYDKSVPPAEAVTVLDDFLSKLCDAGFPVLVISGNHDSAERVGFGTNFMKKSRIYVSPAYGEGKIEPVVLTDSEGTVNFYLLPFLRPSAVRAAYPDAEITTYTDALRTAIEQLRIDPDARNVLIAHQFVAGGETGGSEELTVGTLEKVDAEIFGAFDYVALGHIHRAQDVGSRKIRYCGTPLKYSVKEANHHKSVTFATLGKKGELETETVELHPIRNLTEKKKSFEELMREPASKDYIFAHLTDTAEVPNAMAELRRRFPNLMALDYPYAMFADGDGNLWVGTDTDRERSPQEILTEFFEKAGMDVTGEMQKQAADMIEAASRAISAGGES